MGGAGWQAWTVARRTGHEVQCPWCERPVPARAEQCPSCRFPFTLSGADAGAASAQPLGTSSTASSPPLFAPVVSVRGAPSPPAGGRPSARGQRARTISYLFAVLAVLLLVSALASLMTLRDPRVSADAVAQRALFQRFERARGSRPAAPDDPVELDGDVPSRGPGEVSVATGPGAWFGAVRSSVGSCLVLGGLVERGARPFAGTLDRREPCTGEEARLRLHRRVAPVEP